MKTVKKWTATFLVAASAIVMSPSSAEAMTVQEYFQKGDQGGLYVATYTADLINNLQSTTDSKGNQKPKDKIEEGMKLASFIKNRFFSDSDDVIPQGITDVAKLFVEAKEKNPDAQVERIINAYIAQKYKAFTAITTMPNLVAFWTFGEEAGQPRVSTGTKEKHPLSEVGGEIPRINGGPFSGYAANLNGKQYFKIPYAETGDLNIGGPGAEVSMFAVVSIENLRQSRTIAGMWSEGKGANDDTGTRQYSLLMNMPTYGGPNKLTPHISSEGGVTRRADGSAFPWCADYAATAKEVPTNQWCTLGFTYDGKYIRAYINGVLDKLELDATRHKRTDRYFTQEGPDGKDRGMNPYYHGRGIFRYDPDKHKDRIGGSDFTVGARYAVGSMLKEATIGKFGGLAVFNRAITEEEMKKLHDAANISALKLK